MHENTRVEILRDALKSIHSDSDYSNRLNREIAEEALVATAAPAEATLEMARKIGEIGSAHVESERLLLEEYLRGHCWKAGLWNAEKNEYEDIATRIYYAVWRARAALGVAPTQQRVESQWISCDERLPDCCTEVIVWPHPSDVCMTGECDKNGRWTYAEHESNWGWHAINILPRTHWMPLPKPPTTVQPVAPAKQEPTAEQVELSDDKSITFARNKWNAFARFIQADIKSGDCSTNFINAWMELEAEGKS